MASREVRCGNPECGALNRLSGYSLLRIPKCGRCGTKLPEGKRVELARKIYTLRGWVWMAIPVFAFVLWNLVPHNLGIRNNSVSLAQCVGKSQPQNGIYKWYGPTWGPDVARFTIKTPAGANYFVKLEDELGRSVRAYFVHGGSTISNLVPLGVFSLKYATGSSWCSEQELFGPDTSTIQANEMFTFEHEPGYTPTDWTVELIRQPGGNLRTHPIPRGRF